MKASSVTTIALVLSCLAIAPSTLAHTPAQRNFCLRYADGASLGYQLAAMGYSLDRAEAKFMYFACGGQKCGPLDNTPGNIGYVVGGVDGWKGGHSDAASMSAAQLKAVYESQKYQDGAEQSCYMLRMYKKANL